MLKDPSFATHMVLDVVGLIPVIGEPADVLNAIIYAAEGNYMDASLSAAGAIPFVGWTASGVQIAKATYRAANAAVDVANAATMSPREVLGVGDEVVVNGRLPDTKVLKDVDEYRVLDVDHLTPEFNAAWVDEVIDQKRIVYTASPTEGN